MEDLKFSEFPGFLPRSHNLQFSSQ